MEWILPLAPSLRKQLRLNLGPEKQSFYLLPCAGFHTSATMSDDLDKASGVSSQISAMIQSQGPQEERRKEGRNEGRK